MRRTTAILKQFNAIQAQVLSASTWSRSWARLRYLSPHGHGASISQHSVTFSPVVHLNGGTKIGYIAFLAQCLTNPDVFGKKRKVNI